MACLADPQVRDNRTALDKITEVLLEKETLTGGEGVEPYSAG